MRWVPAARVDAVTVPAASFVVLAALPVLVLTALDAYAWAGRSTADAAA
jgi:hypothetical protein